MNQSNKFPVCITDLEIIRDQDGNDGHGMSDILHAKGDTTRVFYIPHDTLVMCKGSPLFLKSNGTIGNH